MPRHSEMLCICMLLCSVLLLNLVLALGDRDQTTELSYNCLLHFQTLQLASMPGLAALECGWISGYALAWQSVCVYGIHMHLYLHCFCSWDSGTFVAWNIMRLCHGGVSLCVFGKLETCICIYLVSVNDGVARSIRYSVVRLVLVQGQLCSHADGPLPGFSLASMMAQR
jgi:hypothetical protein